MARTYPALDDDLTRFITAQPVFFVATAPSGGEGHVNLSPKGYDTFRVVDPTTVAYLDLTGSGAETIAHVRDNGRITLMFCAFAGPPRILRLYGQGEVALPGSPGFDALARLYPPQAGVRSILRVHLDRISTACGYAVPLMRYEGPRETLHDWAFRKGDEGLTRYREEKNAVSIDGLPALTDSTR